MATSQELTGLQASHSLSMAPPANTQPHPHAQKLHDLQIFLNSAPALIDKEMQHIPPEEVGEPRMKRFQLPSGDYISCVLWDHVFHITGTDVVRSLLFRFEVTGRPVRNIKKFEEGVFSDLRNLKPGTASVMEEAKKKQKVFFWFEVDHDRLYLDALDRDLKREKLGMEPTTGELGKSSLSFDYDPRQSLSEQFIGPGSADGGGDGSLERTLRHLGGVTVSPQYSNTNAMAMGMGLGGSAGVPMYDAAPSTTFSRVKTEQTDYSIGGQARLGKRHSDGHSPNSLGDQADESRDAVQNYGTHPDSSGQQLFKRRRGNNDQDMDRSSSSARPGPPIGHVYHHPTGHGLATAQQHATASRSSSFGVARIPSWRMDASTFADSTTAGGLLQQQSTATDGEVRVVPHMRNDGGGNDPQLWGMHAAEDEPTLTCPVPICRQVFVGKQVMVKHMRTHNEQDWTAKSRSISAPSTTLITPHRPNRSSSAEAHAPPPQRNNEATFNFAVPQYPRSTDSGTLSNPSTLYLAPPSVESKALSANSSPSAGTFPRTPQQQLSPTQTSLSIESAPTSILDEPHHYQPRHSTYPLTTRGLFPGYSPGSNSSAEVPGAFTFDRGQQSAATSAPPSRITFQQQNGQPSQSWNLWGNGSQKEVALRRFRSATPTIGGGQQTASPSMRTAPIPHGSRTPDDSFRPEAYRRASPTSHLGLYPSPQSHPGHLAGDLQVPVQKGYLTSPATALSASPLQHSDVPQDNSPTSFVGGASLAADESRIGLSISPGYRADGHLPTDVYTAPPHPIPSTLSSEVVASTLSGSSHSESAPNPNFNPVDARVPVHSTNMVHSYPSGPISYTYAPNYTTYSSYAV